MSVSGSVSLHPSVMNFLPWFENGFGEYQAVKRSPRWRGRCQPQRGGMCWAAAACSSSPAPPAGLEAKSNFWVLREQSSRWGWRRGGWVRARLSAARVTLCQELQHPKRAGRGLWGDPNPVGGSRAGPRWLQLVPLPPSCVWIRPRVRKPRLAWPQRCSGWAGPVAGPPVARG